MGSSTAIPASCRGSRLGGKTAFERNLLPGFAHWVIQEIERRRPDFLIPAETKGVRVLEAVLTYAREELGTPITVPVLYGAALSYVDREDLRGSRVMIIDDAVRTGTSLSFLRAWVARHEVADIQALACIGLDSDTPERRRIDCYRSVDAPLYQQYVWQLTELVVSRGLPPEVDHFVFELRLPGRLSLTCRQLQAVLAEHGDLTIDGPAAKRDELQPMSLHFPRLPASRGKDPASPHHEGPNKIRFFPDQAGERIFVVPISLPALSLEVGEGEDVPLEQARQKLREALGGRDLLCDLLLAEAATLDPKTVFRAQSTCMEIELVRGLCELLGASFPGAEVSEQREPFDRLYGPAAGERVAALVGREILDALARGAEQADEAPVRDRIVEPDFLDASVAKATRSIATELKALYDDPDHDPAIRVGRTMPQIEAMLAREDPLLASRCISFGLAMTTLVPYVEAIPQPDGTLKVERFYRVSENNRGQERPYTDLDRIRLDKSEQALAVICHRLRTRCAAYRDKPIPTDLLTGLVAILRPLVLAEHSIALTTCPAIDGPRLVLLDSVVPIGLDDEESTTIAVEDDGVMPTEEFLRLYDQKRLALDLDGSTEAIETHVDLLAPLAEEVDEERLETLRRGWAMSTDRRLGLSHVRASIDAALAELRRPLRLMLAGRPHERSARVGSRARRCVETAHAKLALLEGEWSKPALARWPRPGRREQRLLDSLGTPRKPAAIYELPAALASLVAKVGELVDRLDAASAREWAEQNGDAGAGEPDGSAVEVATATLAWCATIRRALLSFADDGDIPGAPADPREAIAAAAADLLDVTELLGAFVAATAGVFRGPEDGEVVARAREEKRHGSILSLDLAGSTAYSDLHGPEMGHLWKNEGLDVAAQWTRVFGAWPVSDRRGDDIAVEFDGVGDAVVLCGAAIQQHMAALRSTGAADLSWRSHCGVDCGQIHDGRSNVTGPCIDRAAKLAKKADEDALTDDVYATQEAGDRCSPKLREKPLARKGAEVELGRHDGVPVAHRPHVVDSAGAMRYFAQRLRNLAELDAYAIPALRDIEPPLDIDDSDERDDSEEGGAAASS